MQDPGTPNQKGVEASLSRRHWPLGVITVPDEKLSRSNPFERPERDRQTSISTLKVTRTYEAECSASITGHFSTTISTRSFRLRFLPSSFGPAVFRCKTRKSKLGSFNNDP